MIRIDAIVRPERVNVVLDAMSESGCTGFTYSNVTGRGTQQGVEVFTGRGGQTVNRSALSKTLLVTVVPNEMKETIIETILGAARSPDGGQIGDGKIIISQVEDVIRVRTRERGDSAI